MAQVMGQIDVGGLSEAISERIIRLISDGVLKPGDSLPPQRQLAAQLGVSLACLREALHALAAVGVIEVKHGRGTFVCAHPTDPLVKQLDWALLLQTQQTRELMEARRLLEVSLAGYAAQRATAEQRALLLSLFEGMMEAWRTRDMHRLEELDIRFHLTLAESSGNSLLFHLAQTLYAVVEQFIRVVPHTQTGMENHRRVLQAVLEGNSAQAERAMRALLDQTERLYAKQSTSSDPSAPRTARLPTDAELPSP